MRKILYLIILLFLFTSSSESNEETLDSIFYEILSLELEHPTIVYSQILLESGHLTSPLYKSNKNLFGMKKSGSRATTSNKIVGNYKWYSTWRESLVDYALLQMAFYKSLSREEYFKKLSRVYASDPNYVTKLKTLEAGLQLPVL